MWHRFLEDLLCIVCVIFQGWRWEVFTGVIREKQRRAALLGGNNWRSQTHYHTAATAKEQCWKGLWVAEFLPDHCWCQDLLSAYCDAHSDELLHRRCRISLPCAVCWFGCSTFRLLLCCIQSPEGSRATPLPGTGSRGHPSHQHCYRTTRAEQAFSERRACEDLSFICVWTKKYVVAVNGFHFPKGGGVSVIGNAFRCTWSIFCSIFHTVRELCILKVFFITKLFKSAFYFKTQIVSHKEVSQVEKNC